MNYVLITPVLLLVVAFTLAMSWWFVRNRSTASRRLWLLFLCGALFGIPWLNSRDSIVVLGLLMLVSCAVFAPKLLDAHLDPSIWRDRSLGQWITYVLNPFVLCFRLHLTDQTVPSGESIQSLIRSALEMAAGAIVLLWAFTRDWSETPFLIEHFAKLLGIYLFVFDGMFVTMNSLLRLAGGRYLDFSRHPIAARLTRILALKGPDAPLDRESDQRAEVGLAEDQYPVMAVHRIRDLSSCIKGKLQ